MDANNKTFTPVDVLDIAMNQLLGISVPISHMEQIGTPIHNTVNILNELKKAFLESKNENAPKQNEEDEIAEIKGAEADG